MTDIEPTRLCRCRPFRNVEAGTGDFYVLKLQARYPSLVGPFETDECACPWANEPAHCPQDAEGETGDDDPQRPPRPHRRSTRRNSISFAERSTRCVGEDGGGSAVAPDRPIPRRTLIHPGRQDLPLFGSDSCNWGDGVCFTRSGLAEPFTLPKPMSRTSSARRHR